MTLWQIQNQWDSEADRARFRIARTIARRERASLPAMALALPAFMLALALVLS